MQIELLLNLPIAYRFFMFQLQNRTIVNMYRRAPSYPDDRAPVRRRASSLQTRSSLTHCNVEPTATIWLLAISIPPRSLDGHSLSCQIIRIGL